MSTHRTNTVQRFYNGTRAAKAVYGTILIFATLIGFQHTGSRGGYQLALSVLLAAAAIVLAEIYAEILGETIRQRSKLRASQRHEIQNDSLAIISVSVWPALFFVLSELGLWSDTTAFLIGYAYCLLVLFIFSYWASRLGGLGKVSGMIRSCIIVAVGIVVVMLKYTLGH